ncbi:MAG: DUF58 domain-containing protein [bacterium]|nr:DUF58 domain-containing protein [bacterium]
MAKLFGDDFLRAIAHLRIVARNVPAGGRHAEHRSGELGSGMEFRDFRSYTPGDDIRRVDWNLYRRSGRLFLRLFEEPQDLPVYILLDSSDSMYFESPPRADAARQLAGAMAAVGLNQFDRVGIYPFGADLVRPLGPLAGKQMLGRALAYLERQEPSGPTNLVTAIRRISALNLRRGLVLLISDFFDPGGLEAVIEALRSLRHRLLLVQVTQAADAAPSLLGELRLCDCEFDARGVTVTVTPALLERYRQAYGAFCRQLAAFAARRGAGHVQLEATRPVLGQLSGLFVDGVLRT